MTGEDSTQIQLTQSVQKLKLGFKTKWGIQRTPYISSYFHDLPVASRQRPLAVPSNILNIQTPFRTLRTYTNALPRHTKEKCLHRSRWLRIRQIHYNYPLSMGCSSANTNCILSAFCFVLTSRCATHLSSLKNPRIPF
jgi:hypothetical protein